MPSFIQWVAIIGIIAVLTGFAIEVRRWKTSGMMVGKYQRKLRIALVLLVEILFVMMLAGAWVASRGNIITELIYWTICVFLGLMIIVLAMLDLRAVLRGYASYNKQIREIMREDERK